MTFKVKHGISVAETTIVDSVGNISAANLAVSGNLTVSGVALAAKTETLSNKTITFANNTITGTLAQLSSAITDADVASTDFVNTAIAIAITGGTGAKTISVDRTLVAGKQYKTASVLRIASTAKLTVPYNTKLIVEDYTAL